MTRALLDAATELFAGQGPARVSVRDIAERARVNHGLVHRHFGSKEGLLRAVLQDLSEKIHAERREDVRNRARPGGDPLVDTFSQTFDAVTRHPAYFRVLSRALLDGYPMDRLQGSFPVVEELVASFRAAQRERRIDPSLDAGMTVALMISTAFGWLLFEPYVLMATGQRDVPLDDARRKALGAWKRIAAVEPRR